MKLRYKWRIMGLLLGSIVGGGAVAFAESPILLSEIARDSDARGFLIHGSFISDPLFFPLGDRAGRSVRGLGDLNGDGLADVCVMANAPSPYGPSTAHILYGRAGGERVEISEVRRDADARGYAVYPQVSTSLRGVGALGDMNGDLLDDFIVGAPGHAEGGKALVILGSARKEGVNLSSLFFDPGLGFAILPSSTWRGDFAREVSGAGGFLGEPGSDVLITGSTEQIGQEPLRTLAVAIPLAGVPEAELDLSCYSDTDGQCMATLETKLPDFVAESRGFLGAGDVNGDGIPDAIMVSTPSTSDLATPRVIFGGIGRRRIEITAGFPDDGAHGYSIMGAGFVADAGVAPVGDVNGDGLADLAVAVNGGFAVVFGKADQEPVDLSDIVLDHNPGGFLIHGSPRGDYPSGSVSGVGDVNGDGYADILVGMAFLSPLANPEGDAYIVFGKPDGVSVDLGEVLAGDGSGIMLQGPGIYSSYISVAVSGAGDVNGDGLPDVIVGLPSVSTTMSCGDRGCLTNDQPGAAYVVFSPFTAPAPATYRAYSRVGFAPRAGIGILGDQTLTPPDSRLWIGFAAGGAGESGSRSSLETVRLVRQRLVHRTAGVAWHLETDRRGWGTADVHLKYVDSEAAGLSEANLVLYHAPSIEGPWTLAAASLVMPERNRIVATLDESAFGNAGWLVLGADPDGPGRSTQTGDVNADGVVTPADAQWAFECFLGACPSGADTAAGDLCPPGGGDGALTPSDVQAIFLNWLGATPRCE
ncbi:MAG: FG-GAP repeat protein [Candidatus Sumerlaeia bacterium]|nr:FG-GAP repeat protein [Candidatus Sumerlaeia bacterium]